MNFSWKTGFFSFDYENKSVEALADFITNIDENRLEEVAKIGRERALAYDETEYARLISKGNDDTERTRSRDDSRIGRSLSPTRSSPSRWIMKAEKA